MGAAVLLSASLGAEHLDGGLGRTLAQIHAILLLAGVAAIPLLLVPAVTDRRRRSSWLLAFLVLLGGWILSAAIVFEKYMAV